VTPRVKRLSLVGLALLAGCAALPSGPSVMSLPGSRKNFDEFRVDDAACRQFAFEQVGGASAQQAANQSAVGSAVVGTAVGAGAGALIAGSSGAGVGAGVGLLTGALVGQSYASGSYWSVQQRYDFAYQQCMYAKGNKIPVSVGYARAIREQSAAAPPGPLAPYPPPPNQPPPPTPR
jgi:hypothetical protein